MVNIMIVIIIRLMVASIGNPCSDGCGGGGLVELGICPLHEKIEHNLKQIRELIEIIVLIEKAKSQITFLQSDES